MRSQATTILALTSSAAAFWRLPCRSRTGLGRLDPLMDRGKVSDHVHAIHGGGNFGFNADSASLSQSACTSCQVTQDRSAYWTPVPYFVYSNGTAVIVPQVGGMLAYYLLLMDNLKPFPEGFQMVAGTKTVRNFTGVFPDTDLSSWPTDPTDQFFLEQRALGFNCLNYGRAPEPSLYRHQFPSKEYMDANCVDGIRFELAFPSCSNGSPDSADHKSHMAYPSLVKEGNCPEGFDTHYPFLFFETIWATNQFAGEDGQLVLSHGDPLGTGYHGDFIMGWESSDFLGQAIKECTSISGNIQDCPLFTIQSESAAAECTFEMPEELKDDNPTGPRDGLPVNVPIQAGPERATAYPVAGRTGVPTSSMPATTATSSWELPTLPYTAANPSETSTAQGGIVIKEKVLPTNSSAEAPPSSTITAAPSLVSASVSDAKVVATSWMTNGNEVVEMIIEEVDITVTTTAASSAGSNYKRHVHKHRHNHGDPRHR